MEMLTLFRQYTSDKCDEGGKQESNLNRSQQEGLRSLKRRVREGELVVIPTGR